MERDDSFLSSSFHKDEPLWRLQAGGGKRNRFRRRQNFKNRNEQTAVLAPPSSPLFLPEPLLDFDSIESVSLVSVDEISNGCENGQNSKMPIPSSTSSIVAKVQLKNNVTPIYLDPRIVHQTKDHRLWMTLRDLVDVSASQFSVVLDTNYFNSRQNYLEQKANGISTLQAINNNNNNMNNSTVTNTNASACAWGIKMEPIAFQQYKRIMQDYANVEETGMHIMTYVVNGKTYKFGASPDGIVTETVQGNYTTTTALSSSSTGLLEIKSLWGRRNNKGIPNFTHCPSRYWDQIQGQLAICNQEWCDLMLFIPPAGKSGSGNKRNNSKNKSHAKKKKEKIKKTLSCTTPRRSHGPNYSIVRVLRNETYWNQHLLPALIQFCEDVDALKAEA